MYPVIIFIQSENSELSTFIFLIEKLGKTFSSFFKQNWSSFFSGTIRENVKH